VTLQISTDDTSYVNADTLSGAPAVLISGNNVTFTNATGATISSTSSGQPAITVTGIGSHLINRAGARVEATFSNYDAIRGGSGGDVVDNYGAISGWTRLGDGGDTFNQYFSSASVPTASVDLGDGDDTYNLLIGSGSALFGNVTGGAGTDRLNIAASDSIVYGFYFTGFEHLTLGANVYNLVSFSNLASLTLTPGALNNFITSVNPNVDVALDRNNFFIGPGSSFRNITGSANSESLVLNANSTSGASRIGSAHLGDGNDQVTISTLDDASPVPIVTDVIDGGAGSDTLLVNSRSSQTHDLTRYVGFETLSVMRQTYDTSTTARIAHASGFGTISCSGSEAFLLSDTYLPNAVVNGGSLGVLTLDATTTIGRTSSYYYTTSTPDQQLGNTQYNLSITNNGTIVGAVQLYLGDDFYDGRLGVTGGTIFGYAGNDTLYGGVGNERIEGGYGNDTLDGGGGNNTLLGGAGNDRLIVAATGSGTTIDGGADTDTLVVSGSVTLGGLSNVEAIELQSGATLTLTGAQFSTIVLGSVVSGTGSITINMAVGDLLMNAQFLTIAGGSTLSYVINGSSDSEVIKGGAGATYTINGGDGSDQIRGGNLADIIMGGNGNDKIEGGQGADTLTGGGGGDTFRYQSASASGLGAAADHITDFVSGTDHLGFVLLDANPGTLGIDPFSYIDTQSFHATGAAEIRYETAGADLMVQLDTNGDGLADMAIYLNGLGGGALSSGDFLI
jgi:Ca2+-binding RTX toxin-like protein